MDIQKELSKRGQLVEPVLDQYVQAENPRIQEMLEHTIKSGGKRIRPSMVLLACEAVGGKPRRILPAAAAVELLHTFTLVHDDIMDHDLSRRGRPTVHALWGEAMGIVVGDTLYSNAFRALLDLRKNKVPDEQVLAALEVLVWANSRLQEGQMLDMFFEKQEQVKESEYLEMVEKKTGVLMQASMEIGAILGQGSDTERRILGEYGRLVGVAFQIQDDLLGLLAEEGRLGKPVGSDIRKGKRSLIIVHALSQAQGSEVAWLRRVLGDPHLTAGEITKTVKVLQQLGSIAYARKKATRLGEKAKQQLPALPESEAKKILASLADFIIHREY